MLRMPQSLAGLPAVHIVLAHPLVASAVARWGRPAVRDAVRRAIAEARGRLAAGASPPDVETLAQRALAITAAAAAPAYPEVLNATGVLIHTNLGRAPCVVAPPPSYLALEYELEVGQRGERMAPVVARLVRYFGCPAALVVNNNAAALVLLLAAHAAGRPVVVSRGELIEIGGSFRLPEIMHAAGATLLEVGCTNRTHAADYEAACAAGPAGILVAHRSNFRLSGFVTSPPLAEVVDIAHRHGVPVWVDQGSGAHVALERYGLPHEVTVQELLASGADAVLFSADKLLGAAQGGIIVGSEDAVRPLRRHPLRRALRPGKHALTVLSATLDCYLAERFDEVPLYRMLAAEPTRLRRRASRLARTFRIAGLEAHAVPTRAVLGGGTTPEETLPSWGVALAGGDQEATSLRTGALPVIGRLAGDRLILDLRTVPPEDDGRLAAAVLAAWHAAPIGGATPPARQERQPAAVARRRPG